MPHAHRRLARPFRLRLRWPVVAIVLAAAARAGASGQAPAATTPGLPPARQIITQYVAAIGGEAALNAVRSMRQRGTLEIAAQGLKGEFDLMQARPAKMVLHSETPGFGALDEGFDGKVGWSIDPQGGPAVLAGRELSEMAEDARLDAPLHPAERMASMTTVDRTEFDKRPAFKIRIVFMTGLEQFEYFDVETSLQLGWEGSRATPNGILPTIARFREYKQFGALMFPTIAVTRQLGVEQVLTLQTVEYNTVPSNAFDLPKPIKALVR